jgi:hypothetical protein
MLVPANRLVLTVWPPSWPSLKEGEAILILTLRQNLLTGLNVSQNHMETRAQIRVKFCSLCEVKSIR